MVVVPLTVGVLKHLTHIDCPWDLEGFGGHRPMLGWLVARPAGLPDAACFPGAHSSSAFALFSLYFLWRDDHPRLAISALVSTVLVGALFEDFFDTLSTIDEDRFTVIHTLGSHGPGYHLRYPIAFDHFKPACHEVDFDRCTPAQIVNAYDNTLLYDDHLLAQTIDRLRALSRSVDTALVYVSDHGESLGENGVFLHALPYALAPRVQTQVPMMFWASAGFRSRFGIDIECLRRKSDHSLSHDHLFHSLLGLLSIETEARRPELDFLSDCLTLAHPKPAAYAGSRHPLRITRTPLV
jgi:hypothetical protein